METSAPDALSWVMKLWPFSRKPAAEAKSLAAPEDWLTDIFGIAPVVSGVSVSVEAALRVPAVSAAVRVIAEAAASLDVKVKEVTSEGTEIEAQRPDVLRLLTGSANDWLSGYELIRDLVSDALVYDVGGLAWVNRTEARPQEIIRYARGVLAVEYDQTTGEPSYTINNRPIPSRDVIHLRGPFGRCPVTLAREAIGVAIVLERHAARLFGRGARPSGALMFPKGMGDESAKKARAAWRVTHEDGESARTAILYDGAEFKPFTFNSTDAQFLENRRFQIEEIARAFNVPAPMIGDLTRATWSNSEQKGREFLVYCLEPWLQALEAALSRALFVGEDRDRFVIRFDRDDLTRADLQTRATTINSLISSRTLSPNEGRSWLGLPPRDGGDTFENPNITTPTGDEEQTDDATE